MKPSSPSPNQAPMSVWERIFQAVLFEVGAVALTVLALMVFGSDDVLHTGSLAVAISLLAVLWNVVFNHLFDKVATGERLQRSFGVRLVHMALFEGGLFLVTVPMIAYVLGVSLWAAFVMDLGVVALIGVYTVLFHWAYDYLRFHALKSKRQFKTD